MTSAGPLSAGAASQEDYSGGDTWVNVNNLLSEDGVFATNPMTPGGYSDWLKGDTFGFSIPASATIDGLVVVVKGKVSSGTNSWRVRMIKGGSIGATSPFGGDPNITTTNTAHTCGHSTYLWGETWTPADINASNFGVAIAQAVGGNTPSVDFVSITVYYTAPTYAPPWRRPPTRTWTRRY